MLHLRGVHGLKLKAESGGALAMAGHTLQTHLWWWERENVQVCRFEVRAMGD